MKEEILKFALNYANIGYSIIPIGLNKIPLINWKDYQTKRAGIEEIVDWWTKFPNAQIGIVTGEISNLTVVDIESDGDFNLIKDQTYKIKTGGGGIHLYFQFEKEFKNAVRVFPSVDIRGTGGYVVACPSVMQKGAYSELNTLPVIKMSSGTKKMLLEANKKLLPWNATSGEVKAPDISTSKLEYMGAGTGSRNDSMTKYAGSIHAKLHPSLWDSIGLQMFESANFQNIPPLPKRELDLIWKSISNRESSQNPGGRDFFPRDTTKQWGAEPKKEVVEEAVAEEEFDSKETLHVSEVAELQKIDTDHTYSMDMPPFDDALLGGFSVGELIIMAGQTGVGKTTIIQDWSVTLACGGAEGKRDRLPALWFSYEVLAKPLWQKFQGMGATENTPVYVPRITETGESGWVEEVILGAIKKWGVKVICIDHLGFLRAPKGNYANASDAITQTARDLKRLAVKHGLIIFLPVHVKKTFSKTPDLNDIKNSSGIAQEADTVFFIERIKDKLGMPTSQSKIWLVKNRKTGLAVNATFNFAFGRFYYDEKADKEAKNKETDEKSVLDMFNEWNK